MYKKLSFDEWKEIGDKAKEVRKSLYELHSLLSGKLPKTDYLSKWKNAEESYGELRSHLDDIVAVQLNDVDHQKFSNIFYGQN